MIKNRCMLLPDNIVEEILSEEEELMEAKRAYSKEEGSVSRISNCEVAVPFVAFYERDSVFIHTSFFAQGYEEHFSQAKNGGDGGS